MRIALGACLAAGLVVLGGTTTPALPSTPTTAPFYVVRPDPRMCPSPLCGGYWVSLANRARTRCADDLLRPRCYVARAADERGQPLPSAVPAEALVRGAVGPGSDDLGVLVTARVFSPVGRAAPAGRYYRLADNGIRCVRAPCFSLRASLLNRSSSTTVSGIDLGTAPIETRSRIEAALGSKQGILARGRIVPTSNGGRGFQTTRFFLASEH
jgi:hypothetical protein